MIMPSILDYFYSKVEASVSARRVCRNGYGAGLIEKVRVIVVSSVDNNTARRRPN
jgi:hypothetical protein